MWRLSIERCCAHAQAEGREQSCPQSAPSSVDQAYLTSVWISTDSGACPLGVLSTSGTLRAEDTSIFYGPGEKKPRMEAGG